MFGADDWTQVSIAVRETHFGNQCLYFQPLLARIPEDILPPRWGGTKTVDEGICLGGEVTQDYFTQSQPVEIPGEKEK